MEVVPVGIGHDPQIHSMDSFMAGDTIRRWLVPDFIPRGAVSLVAAKPKVGKSVLLQNLAVAVSQGESFLGIPCPVGDVLYLAPEEIETEFRLNLTALGITTNSQRLRVRLAPTPDNYGPWLRNVLLENPSDLVIVDTFQRLTRVPDINDYALVYNAMEPITRMARDFDAAFVLAHHGSKRQMANSDSVLGSTALFAAVDSLIFLDRKPSDRREIRTWQRYGTDLPAQTLEMDEETKRVKLGDPESPFERACRVIRDALEDGAQHSRTELATATSVSTQTLTKAIRYLVTEKAVTEIGDGRRGSPFVYRLA